MENLNCLGRWEVDGAIRTEDNMSLTMEYFQQTVQSILRLYAISATIMVNIYRDPVISSPRQKVEENRLP